jgi:hypothetical protein
MIVTISCSPFPSPETADNKKAASVLGRLWGLVDGHDWSRPRQRAHHQLPMFIELIMREEIQRVSFLRKRISSG